MSQKSPSKAEFMATLNKLVSSMLAIDRQTKTMIRQLSHAEYIWHEAKSTAQRLNVETKKTLKETVEMLNHADPILNDKDDRPGAPYIPTNPNPWSAIEIGISMLKLAPTQTISSPTSVKQ
ncbi:hypothetical protein FSST1_011133 [Fusarium sambucinum]